MTTEASPAPVEPVTTDPPVAQPAQATRTISTTAAAVGAEVRLTSDQLKARLADERRAAEKALLTKYGIEKPEDLDAKLKTLAEHEAAQLSEKERIEKQITELTKQADAAKRDTAVATAAVQELFDALPEYARQAIEELQPATPGERHKLVQTYRKMVAAAAQDAAASASAQPATTIVTPPAPPPPAPANTAPVSAAPKPGGKSKYTEYQELKAQKPLVAAMFYKANQRAIEESRPVPT